MKKITIILIAACFILFSLVYLINDNTGNSATSSKKMIWSKTEKVTDEIFYKFNMLAVEASQLHLPYVINKLDEKGKWKLFYTKRADEEVWAKPIKLLDDLYAGNASVIVRDEKLHVAYIENSGKTNLLYKTNASGSWSKPVKLYDNKTNLYGPQLIKDNKNLYLVFQTDDNKKILFAENIDGSWARPQVIATDAENFAPTIAVNNGTIHIAWTHLDESKLGSSIKYRMFSNGKWSETQTAVSSKIANYNIKSLAIVKSKPCFIFQSFQPPENGYKIESNINFAYENFGKWIVASVTPLSEKVADHVSPLTSSDNKLSLIINREYPEVIKSEILIASINDLSEPWNIKKLVITKDNGLAHGGNLAVDDEGKTHVVYGANDILYYLKEL